jgi:plasmid stabilization system protein ParE
VERDLVRLHAFLASVNPHAVGASVQQLMSGAEQLLKFPQLGVPLDEFASRDVQRVIVGDYEVRYERTPTTIYILRLWHAQKDR